MTCNVISSIDQIRHIDRVFTETQVRNRYAAGFLGVISKICLGIHVGVVTDDLDGGFVGANSTVGTEAPEFAGCKAFRVERHLRSTRQGEVGYIINDADGETIERMFFLDFFKYREDIFRNNVFGAKAGTAADNVDIEALFFNKVNNIQIQRFAKRTRFFCTVDDSDFLNRLRQYSRQIFSRERTIQMNVDGTNFFTFAVQIINSLFNHVRERTHGNDNRFSIFCAVVVKRFVCTACDFRNLSHVVSNDIRHSVIEAVAGFCVLEVYIRVFSSATDFRFVRIQSTFTESFDSIPVNQFAEVIIIHNFDFLNFMRCTETIKEIDERKRAFQSCQVSNATKVHNFLDIGFS